MKSEKERPAMFEKAPPDPDFPKPGAKLRYKGTHMFWFTDILKNAEMLVKGEEYTLKTIDVASSWCCITLEETGGTKHALSFFTYESKT